jgi:hypothetical protein
MFNQSEALVVVLNEEQGHWTPFWKYHNRRQTNGKSSFDPLALVT